MFEIPTNLTLVDKFAEIFDERNAAVKRMIAQAIAATRAKPQDRHLRPSAKRLSRVRAISGRTISLNPDTVLKTTMAISEKENAQKTKVRVARK